MPLLTLFALEAPQPEGLFIKQCEGWHLTRQSGKRSYVESAFLEELSFFDVLSGFGGDGASSVFARAEDRPPLPLP